MKTIGEHEIRTLGDDEVISEPGFYAIDIERHHNQPCDDFSVTSGVLRRVELYSPEEMWATHSTNPEADEKKDTDALRLGRVMAAFHEHGEDGMDKIIRITDPSPPTMSTVAEMIDFANSGAELIKGPPNKPTMDQIIKYVEGKATPAALRSIEYWQDMEADPRIKISQKEWDLIRDMGNALAEDPIASAVMGGIPEVSMAWKDAVTGIWCLARPDTVNFSGLTTDYKKMSPQGGRFDKFMVDQRITQHGYDMQGAFACEGFQVLTQNWPGFGIIAQKDVKPYSVILQEIADEDLEIGMFRNHRALRTIKKCRDEGHWPGPGEDTGVYKRPEWQRDRLRDDMAKAGVA